MTWTRNARFSPGELVHHRLYDYRAVVVDVDPEFALSEQWYQQIESGHPPKDQPWYRLLVEDSEHQTYVAERNLEADETGEPVAHHQLHLYFKGFRHGRYQRRTLLN